MNDPLEDFVKQNRDAFDDKEPSAHSWARIERNVLGSRSLWNSLTLWRAAAVLLLGLCVYLLVPKQKLATEQTSMKDFSEVEAFYIKQISEKVKLIDGFDEDRGVSVYGQDFYQLQAMYLVLKEEMKQHPSQKVKDALVLNLLVQMDLLNQQLRQLERESSKDENTEKSGKSV